MAGGMQMSCAKRDLPCFLCLGKVGQLISPEAFLLTIYDLRVYLDSEFIKVLLPCLDHSVFDTSGNLQECSTIPWIFRVLLELIKHSK